VLKVTPINDFREYYDRGFHGYDGNFIRNITSNSAKRKLNVSVIRSIPETLIKMTSVEDGGRCGSEKWRLLPREAVAFVYKLKRKHHLIPNRMVVVDSIRKNLRGFVRTQNTKCIPLNLPPTKRVIHPGDCVTQLTVPIPVQENTLGSVMFTVEFVIVDARNRVLRSSSKQIEIATHVPIIVSIGDSFASGEGNPDQPGEAKGGKAAFFKGEHCELNTTHMIINESKPEMTRNPVWFEGDVHRSLNSPHALAAKELLKEWPFVVFLSFARTGAKVSSGDRKNVIADQLREISSLLGEQKIDILLVSAGVNDVGFADILSSFGSDFLQNTSDRTRRIFENKLANLRNNGYPELDRQIRNFKINVGKVVINEYPGHLFCGSDGKPKGGCGVFETFQLLRVSRANAARMDSMGVALNKEVRRAADNFGWHYVTGISEKFKTHGYCSGQSYYVAAEQSCKKQGDFMGTMHPNANGISVCATAIGTDLRRLLRRPRTEAVARNN